MGSDCHSFGVRPAASAMATICGARGLLRVDLAGHLDDARDGLADQRLDAPELIGGEGMREVEKDHDAP
jgi:hypothetical protein